MKTMIRGVYMILEGGSSLKIRQGGALQEAEKGVQGAFACKKGVYDYNNFGSNTKYFIKFKFSS